MAGYTRTDTANEIANGNVVDADLFDAEYNAIEGAFNATTGHSHDGTAAEGFSELVRYKGNVGPIVESLLGGIRSGLSYSGARNIRELKENNILKKSFSKK